MNLSAGFAAVETAPQKNLARRATVVVVAAAAAVDGVVAAALPMLRRGVRTTAAGTVALAGLRGRTQRDERKMETGKEKFPLCV